MQNCPASALKYVDQGEERTLLHNMTLCARCGNCWRICPREAIEFEHLLDGNWDEVATMNLVRCIVCGEPLYTVKVGDTLTEKLEHKVDALCPLHRKTLSLVAWKHLAPGRDKEKGAGK